METADMSIVLGNDSIVRHPMNNNKKMINDSGSDVHFDSGYASTASISYNQTVASTSNSMKKSLEPIAENFELTFNEECGPSIIETPTTRSIRQLSEFHIQTPENDKHMQETTPTKANYFSHALRSSQRSCTKKNRNAMWSPYKMTPNKRNGNGANYSSMHHLSFIEKMKSAEKHKHFGLYDTTDIENVENSFETSANERSIEFSPIGYHNKSLISTAPIMHDNNKRTLQRHPSGIESSTPISRSNKRTHTQTVAKTHFGDENSANARLLLRKTQSFSPAKRSANILKEITTNSRTKLERHDEQSEDDEAVAAKEHNPARKMLAFSANQFDKLLTGSIATMTNQSKTASQIESSVKEPMTPTKSLQTKRASTLQRQQRILFSPSPTRNEMAKQSIKEKAMRRPLKKLERSASYNPTPHNENRIEKVQLATSIYCTPPKSYCRNPLKRSAACAIADESNVSEMLVEPPAKRQLYYDGVEQMDILTRLKGANNVTDVILSMLSDEDLYASYFVCKSWLQIITSNTSAYARQSKYARDLQHRKENVNAPIDRIEPARSIAENIKRKPFARRNNHYSLRPSPRRSPPVSPSKRKFHENQKVVKKLKPGQRLARCPRCNGNSIVYAASEPLPPSPSPQKMKPMLARRKGYSCPTPDTGHANLVTSTKPWKSFDERKKSNAVISEYAACTVSACGYSFCTNCHCERHIDSICPVRPISSSPTSDEDTTILRPSDRRSSRRNLRRLLN